MRIDGTHSPEANGVAPSTRGAARPASTAPEAIQPESQAVPAAGGEAKGLSLDHIRQVLAAADRSAERIAKAKEMLASGELDTPEAARRAAENMMKFGV